MSTTNPVFRSTVESLLRAILVAAATWASIELGPETLGPAVTGLGAIVVAAITLGWSAWRHKQNVLIDPNTIKKSDQPPFGGSAAGLILICVMAGVGMIGVGGCQAVGPVRTVGTVQTSNDPLNASSVVEGTDELGNPTIAWNDSTNGPVSTVKQTESENLVRKTGQVTREISFRDGQRTLLISAGSDLSAEGVTIDPASGVLTVGRFSTSSSEPIRALN